MEGYESLNKDLKVFLSGLFAGFMYTNVAFIFDLLKVRAQENKNSQMSYMKEISRIYKREGIKGFSRGYQGMLIRDGPGFGLYFMVFENNKRRLGVSDQDRINHNYHGMSESQIGLRQAVSGGVAGCLTWTLAYPADTIKTKLQTVQS